MDEVIIQLSDNAINRIIHNQINPQENQLDKIIATMKIKINPLHPDHIRNKDNELDSWFNIQVDEEKVDTLVMNLNNCSEVLAAYKKPQGEPP